MANRTWNDLENETNTCRYAFEIDHATNTNSCSTGSFLVKNRVT